jgi:hypothetical protein
MLRIGAGFRLGRHVYIGASVPLFWHHARALAAHAGHHGGGAGIVDAVLAWFALFWLVGRAIWPNG